MSRDIVWLSDGGDLGDFTQPIIEASNPSSDLDPGPKPPPWLYGVAAYIYTPRHEHNVSMSAGALQKQMRMRIRREYDCMRVAQRCVSLQVTPGQTLLGL